MRFYFSAASKSKGHPHPPRTDGRTSLLLLVALSGFLSAPSVRAETPALQVSSIPEPDSFNLLSFFSRDHDFDNERWNAYGQATYVIGEKKAFYANYTNLNGSPNSLSPDREKSFTDTVTAFLALKGWTGGDFYLVPEMIIERPLSGLHGLGGSVQNFELQKNGSESPTYYVSRGYFRQTFRFGGEPVKMKSGPMQLGETVDSRRLVITAGKLSILDTFDRNGVTGDLRQSFLNMAFMTYAAYDFAADARGYSFGLNAEYYYDDWAFRVGRFAPPKNPNQLPLEPGFIRYHGDQAEIEHRHTLFGKPGAVRLLAYRNHEFMGNWNDAINIHRMDPSLNATDCLRFNYDSKNATAPDLCWARKPNNKLGAGLNLEQTITDNIGVFFRGMRADGRTEVYAYTSTDSSASLGTVITGGLWHRPGDSFGIGLAEGWISSAHAEYLNAGGIDGFIGDGKLTVRAEQALDVFYKLNLFRILWLSVDFQHISNPAYNADRGPANIISFRAHAEF